MINKIRKKQFSALSLLTISLITTLFINGCKNNNETQKTNRSGRYGEVLRFNNNFEFRSLYPLNITEMVSHRIANQLFESLTALNPATLEVEPQLATKWEVNNDAKIFTFYLRKGVYFHDDPCFPNGKGREITARDIKYCFDKVCEYSPLNQMFWLFKDKVKGANEYYELSKKTKTLPKEGVKGIKILDDYTLQIELNYSYSIFPKMLTHPAFWIYPKEALNKYTNNIHEHPVGTGPFKLKKIKPGEAVVLTRNPNYWQIDSTGNPLPYLGGIKFSFITNYEMAFLEFKKGNIDISYLSPVFNKEIKQDIAENKYKLKEAQTLNVTYLTFNCQTEPFNNKHIRQAFQYAIDINQLSRFRATNQKIKGIVPPIKDYPFYTISPIHYSEEQAKKLFVQSGYTKQSLSSITLNVPSGYAVIGEVIQKMIYENLNIEINVQETPYDKLMDLAEQGKIQFWINGWSADYPDPENFLNLFYGKNVPKSLTQRSFINPSRYQSEKFDHYFEMALKTVNPEERNKFYALADQTIINDAVAIPFRYAKHSRIIQNRVKNFTLNGMGYFDFSKVYIKNTADSTITHP